MPNYTAFSSNLPSRPPRPLDEIIAMSPEAMARASQLVSGAYAELLAVAGW